MPTIQKLLPLLIIIIISFSLTCSQSTEPNPPPFKDPREMTWTVDTLAYPGNIQTLMSSISVCSINDILLSGHGDGGGDMWHYDGTEWLPIRLHDLNISISDYNDFYTYNCNNIFLAGMQGRTGLPPLSKIIKYDGENWIDLNVQGNVELLGIHGDSENNIWACGRDGIVIRYDGSLSEIDTTHLPISNEYTHFHKDIAVYNGETFIITSAHNTITNRNRYYFIRGDFHNWTISDSLTFEGGNYTTRWGIWGLYSSDYGKLYSYGPGGIWEWNDNRWIQILDIDFVIEGMMGINTDYIIAVGQFENVYFYDGINWTRMNEFVGHSPYFSYTDVWTDGYETFVIGYTTYGWPMKTFVWRGK